MAKRWSDLDGRTRALIVTGAIVEGSLKTAMLIDLWRRPASQVRGSKRAWRLSLIPNTAGLIPLSYFVFGRRRSEPGEH
jgi:hypothetical protein